MPASSGAPSHGSRSPSPLSTAYSQDSVPAEFTGSYFAPIAAPIVRMSSIDSDVQMTDATDGTGGTGHKAESGRDSSPLSTASTGTSAANSSSRKRSFTGGASSSSKRGGAKGATSRGGGSSNGRSNGGGSSSTAKPKKKGVAIPTTSKSKSKTKNGDSRREHTATSSPSPRRIKRESYTSDEDDAVKPPGRRRIHMKADDEDEDEGENENENGYEESGGAGDGGLSGLDGNTSDNGPYCICRGPDDHRWMIQCDDCEDWFHGDCVKINKDEGESMMLSYICPNCTIPGRYVTRYRRLCSLPGCRKAARLYGDDGSSALEAGEASHFCSDNHRDQWWDSLLGRIVHGERADRKSSLAATEAKMAVDLFTPAQLVAVLAHTDEPGVAQMLLHGLVSDSNKKTAADIDAIMTVEERATTAKSAADRYHLAEQIVMCKKMLQLLDMAKTRSQEAIKAGIVERDSCGYDERLQHVAVQPHFGLFLASPEGVALFKEETLQAPQFDEDGKPIDYTKNDVEAADDEDEDDEDDARRKNPETAGMCGKRKCKAHSSWFSTLARDVRMQMQELTRQAAALRDNETRIRLASVQRSFVKQHSAYEVRHVGDSDNSLTSLADSDDEYGYESYDSESEDEKEAGAADDIAKIDHIEDEDEDMVDLVGYGDEDDDDIGGHGIDTKGTASPAYNGGYGRSGNPVNGGSIHDNELRRNGHSPNTDGTVSD